MEKVHRTDIMEGFRRNLRHIARIDAIIAGISPTAERAAQVDFTDTYYESNLVVIIKK